MECKAKGSASHETCTNRFGEQFWCSPDSKCCGDICVAKESKCCENSNGNNFGCGKDSTCCGNACAGKGSKCCKPYGGSMSTWYPVTEATECSTEESSLLPRSLSKEQTVRVHAPRVPFWVGMKGYSNCRNWQGVEFPCGDYGKCCGDVCANDKDVCCQNTLGADFACSGEGGGCCGNACYGKDSKCCKVGPPNEWYPVSKDTECNAIGSASHETCTNRFGEQFWCSPDSKCCGDICVAKESKCCENSNGNNFGCGKDSTCCGNACAGKGSKCCKPYGGSMSTWYPVTEATECSTEESSLLPKSPSKEQTVRVHAPR